MTYSVQVTITSSGTTYSLSVAQGDDTPGNVAPAYGLADPLVISRSLPTSDRGIGEHPDPDEATLTLIAPDATTYAAMALGDPVAVKVYPAAAFAGTPVTFYGRIATLVARGHDLGVLYTLGCLDYTADLAEVPVGLAAWPAEGAAARLARIRDEAQIGTTLGTDVADAAPPTVEAHSAGAVDAYSAMVDVLNCWAPTPWADEYGTAYSSTFHTNPGRFVLGANITSDLLDPTQPFVIKQRLPATRSRGRRVRYAPPARLQTVSGKVTVTVSAANSSPSTGAPILDGGKVGFAPEFTQVKGGGLATRTRVTDAGGGIAEYDWNTATSYSPAAPGTYQATQPQVQVGLVDVLQEIPTVEIGSDPIGTPYNLVILYRCPFRPDERSAWNVGTLSWQVWNEATWAEPKLGELLTVARAVASKLPPNREWITGQVCGTTLTIRDGRPVLELSLLPPTLDYDLNRAVLGSSLGVVSFDSPIVSGVTFTQLNTRDTFNDYSIVRGS